MKISIIVPFCNTPTRLIDELINQLLQLDNTIFETIFINDGSNEEVTNFVESKIKSFKYFKTEKNFGVSHARNIGIKEASGDYLFFVDSDDLLDMKLMEAVNNIIFDDLSIFISDIFFKDIKIYTDELNEIKTEQQLDEIYAKSNIKGIAMRSACGKFFKRDIVLENNISFDEDLPFYEDAMFVSRYYQHVKKFHIFSNIIYHYRMNEQSYSKKFNKDYMVKFSKFFDRYKANFGENKFYLSSLYSDTFNSVLTNKVVKAFKKLHLLLCFKICKDRCVIEAAEYLKNNDLLQSEYKIKLASLIVKRHNILAANKIIFHQMFGSIRIRIGRIFKH